MSIKNGLGRLKRNYLRRLRPLKNLVPSRWKRPAAAPHSAQGPDFVDVRALMRQLSVEELCQTAEQYFARLDDWTYQLSKPFAAIGETPEMLLWFAQVLHGLQPLPGMSVLDFGCGCCWASRYLSQLGCRVIALDVSASALQIGQELYKRQPPIGDTPEPTFLRFDGYRIELPDQSIDRVLCLDALHHVPNLEQALGELARVLAQGGIAGFSEPGPNHSRMPWSQQEMRYHRVIENDIRIREIWEMARRVGFTGLQLALFSPVGVQVGLEDFEGFLDNGKLRERLEQVTRTQMINRQIFFLSKGEPSIADSRRPEGLQAALQVRLPACRLPAASRFSASVTVQNTGPAIWLPMTVRTGGVCLGCHLLDATGKGINYDYARQHLTPAESSRPIQPGEILSCVMTLPGLQPGRYILEFDVVAEHVRWFAMGGSPTVRASVEVL